MGESQAIGGVGFWAKNCVATPAHRMHFYVKIIYLPRSLESEAREKTADTAHKSAHRHEFPSIATTKI
jgi:hypothetical protein